MKYFLLSLFTFVYIDSNAQTITQKPIYKGNLLKVEELSSGIISFLYPDSSYQSIIVLTGFYVESKKSALEIIDKAIFILSMDKTDKDQNIIDNIGNVNLIRYGFQQKVVHISGENKKSIGFLIKELTNIKNSLETYTYSHVINK